jgi:hypothetical protein
MWATAGWCNLHHPDRRGFSGGLAEIGCRILRMLAQQRVKDGGGDDGGDDGLAGPIGGRRLGHRHHDCVDANPGVVTRQAGA